MANGARNANRTRAMEILYGQTGGSYSYVCQVLDLQPH